VESFKQDLINYFSEKFQPYSHIRNSKITLAPKKQRRVNPKGYIQRYLKEHLKVSVSTDEEISNLMEILHQEAFFSILILKQQNLEYKASYRLMCFLSEFQVNYRLT
jgi:hypothetical protein